MLRGLNTSGFAHQRKNFIMRISAARPTHIQGLMNIGIDAGEDVLAVWNDQKRRLYCNRGNHAGGNRFAASDHDILLICIHVLLHRAIAPVGFASVSHNALCHWSLLLSAMQRYSIKATTVNDHAGHV